MAKTFEERFQDRLKAIKGTASPSTATGETVVNAALLRFKNLAADWDISDGKVYVTVEAATSVGFGQVERSRARLELRPVPTVRSLVNKIVESAKAGRRFGGRQLFNGDRLTEAGRKWLQDSARVLIKYVRIPKKDSKTPPIETQLKTYTPTSPLHEAVFKELLFGLAKPQQEQEAQQQEANPNERQQERQAEEAATQE